MADPKAFVAKHGLAVNTPTTIVFGTNAKLHANNTITAGTITDAMLATGAGGTDDSTVLATNTALRSLISAENTRITLVNTNLTGTNTALRSLVSAENARVTLVNTNLTGTNTALRTLVSDRLQVANAATLYLKQTGSAGDEKTVAGQVTFSHNIIVSGNLTVSGTSTTVNTETIKLADNKIVLNSDETGTPSADAGIEVERGTSTNSRLEWIESSDKWQAFNGTTGYDLLLNDGTFAANSALNTQATRINLVNTNLTASNTALRSLITAEAARTTLVNTNLTSTNTAIRSLITAADLTGVKADTLLVKNPASHHTYTTTVASKTSAHPYTGSGSSSAYFLDGKESPSIILAPNMTYRFDQADNTNNGHPLRFYLEAAKTTAYTTNVTTNGTPGSAGAYTQIVVTDATPPVLYYQCSAHGYMGSVASSLTEGTTDHYTEGSTNLYYTNARADARIAAANISALNNVHTTSPSDGQALVWDNSNSYWAPGTVGGSITVQEEGSSLSTAASVLNFVGSAVTATGSGSTKTITISAGGSLTVQEEGSSLSTAATTLNFVGTGVTATGSGSTKTITISGGGGSSGVTVQEEGSSLSTSGTTLNFVGTGVTASGTGATKTITIPTVGGIGANGTFEGEFTTATGNGSTTTFTSPISTNLANNIIVSVDGLMQRPTTDYTISGTTVTFGSAPPASTTVMIRSFSGGLTNKAGINVQTFTGNGSNTVYKLVDPVQSLNDVIVTVNGVVQRPTTDYTYSNPNITFGNALQQDDVIAFRSFNMSSSGGGTTYQAVSSNITLARSKGYMVDCSSARTLTLPTSASIGDEIRIIDATGEADTNNITVARNGHKIQGASADLTISTERAAFGLVYFNVAQGWLLIER